MAGLLGTRICLDIHKPNKITTDVLWNSCCEIVWECVICTLFVRLFETMQPNLCGFSETFLPKNNRSSSTRLVWAAAVQTCAVEEGTSRSWSTEGREDSIRPKNRTTRPETYKTFSEGHYARGQSFRRTCSELTNYSQCCRSEMHLSPVKWPLV